MQLEESVVGVLFLLCVLFPKMAIMSRIKVSGVSESLTCTVFPDLNLQVKLNCEIPIRLCMNFIIAGKYRKKISKKLDFQKYLYDMLGVPAQFHGSLYDVIKFIHIF